MRNTEHNNSTQYGNGLSIFACSWWPEHCFFFFFLSPLTLVALHGETGAMNAKG